VARWILPHLQNRPLTLVRCPNGCDGQCFFQKHASGEPPPGVRYESLPEKKQRGTYMVIDDLRGLLQLAQLGALEIHTWGALADQPDHPDLLVIDLDPDEAVEFPALAQAALATRSLLEARGLVSFVKTTGGKGLHVCAPLDGSASFEQVLAVGHGVADALVASAPDRYVATMSKSKRSAKIFVDYLRNARGATFIAPYSTRRQADAPVAMPLHWDELDGRELPRYTLETAPQRLRQLAQDPWAKLPELRQGF
jgi:bifunctional non-homologous end joining protein LigD